MNCMYYAHIKYNVYSLRGHARLQFTHLTNGPYSLYFQNETPDNVHVNTISTKFPNKGLANKQTKQAD